MKKVLKDPWPFIIFLIALSIRLFYLFEIKDHPFFTNPQLDSQFYDDWAWMIAQWNWIGGDKAFFVSPSYAYFLASVYFIFGHNYFIVKLIQIILGSVTWVLAYLIGKELFNRRVGIIASFIGAFYSYSIFMDGELLKNSLAVFTTTLTIYSVLKAKDRDSALLWLASGIFLGLSVINQPNTLLFLPFIVIWGINWKRKVARNILLTGIFVSGAFLVISPVTIRNYIVEKDLVLVSYNGGVNFFLGNNSDSDGGIVTSRMYKLIPQREEGRTREIPERALDRKLKSSEISSYWFSMGTRFMYENPAAFVRLTLKKFLLFWNWYEIPDNVDYYFFRRFSMILSLPLFSFGIVVPFALIGLLLSTVDWRRHILSYGVVSVFMVSVILFVVFGRYRLLMIPLLTVYAAHSVDFVYSRLKGEKYKDLLLSAFLLVAAWGFSNMTILRYPPEHSQRLLGNLYMKRGLFKEAVSEYEGALRAFPFDAPLRLSYAASLEKGGRKDRALDEYRRLLSFELDLHTKAKIHSAIASILMEKGDRTGAEKEYEDALRLDDKLPDVLNNLAWLYASEGRRLGDAGVYAERALEIEPDNPEYMDTLGMVLLRKGKKTEAAALFEKAAAMRPDEAEFREHLKLATE